jgi:hypothetical protein
VAEIYKFKFDSYHKLLKLYQKYKKLERVAVKYSMNDSEWSAKKMLKATEKSTAFAENVLAKEIFETFKDVKPTLHKRRKDEGYFSWNEIFGDNFEELDANQKECLVGLLGRKFVYELPSEYYNN